MATKAKVTVVRKVANAALLSNGTVRISNVRFSYPHLDKPYKKQGDTGVAKYGVVCLLPKDTHAKAKKFLDEVIADLLKENKIKALAADKKFLRDGDESDKEEHNGHWTVSAREERRPILKEMSEDGELTLVEPEDAKETFYGGCWGSVIVRPWFQSNDWGKRANAGLSAVTKKADDDSFGEGRISEEDVDDSFDDDDDFEAPRKSGGKKAASKYEDEEEDDEPRRKPKRRARDEDEDDDDL